MIIQLLDISPLITGMASSSSPQMVALCGGRNVFEELEHSTPTVSVEAVLAHDPLAVYPGSTAGPSRWSRRSNGTLRVHWMGHSSCVNAWQT